MAATFATTGDGLRCTITLAPSERITGSADKTPKPAATATAALAAAAEVVVIGSEVGIATACRSARGRGATAECAHAG